MRWLTDILKDGTLKDNQYYIAENGVFSNHHFPESIILNKRSGYDRWYYWNKLEDIWNFLSSEVINVNNILRDPSINKAQFLVTGADYEHNTDDPFAKISGTDAMNFSLQTGNVIGFIKKGEYALNISSRFGDNFLKYIISDTDGFLEIEDFGGKDNVQSYEWLVLYLWKIKLKKAFRLGLPKAYITRTEISNKVRGVIDIEDFFLTQNPGKYKCTFREHSFNIDANYLIATVFKKHKNNKLFKDLHMVRNAFETATDGIKPAKSSLLKTPYFSNPYYHAYNELIDLSKLILKDELADFGESSNMNAYLFDVSMLFEYFIRKLLKNNGYKLNDKYSERKTIPSGSIENYKRKLEPDIVFLHGGKIHVFDVKYKSYDFRYGVNREDIFQLHTYIGQYSNDSNQVGTCGLIYPLSEKKWDEKVRNKRGLISEVLDFAGKKINFCVCFLKIPDDDNLKDWKAFKEMFKENYSFFLEDFKRLLNSHIS